MEQTTGSRDNDRNSGTFENLTPMSHKEVVDKNVVELYVRKELSPERELQFEAHYFECRDCAESVAAEQEQRPLFSRPQPWWRHLAFPVLTPVTATLLALVAFQNFYSIPSLKAQLEVLSVPQPNTVITAHPVQMGVQDGESLRTPSATIELILPTGARSPFYRVDLLGQGKEPLSLVVPTPQGSRLSLHVTTEALGHGSYSVLVYGLEKHSSSDGQKIGQYYFNIQ